VDFFWVSGGKVRSIHWELWMEVSEKDGFETWQNTHIMTGESFFLDGLIGAHCSELYIKTFKTGQSFLR